MKVLISSALVATLLLVGCGGSKSEEKSVQSDKSDSVVTIENVASSDTNDSVVNNSSDDNTLVSGEATKFSCDINNSLILKSSALGVSQNTLDLSNKILKDMNGMLDNTNKMKEAVYNTMEIASQTVQKIAEPLTVSDEGKKIFTIDTNNEPYISIKQVLTKKYILVSSPSRFFPDTQSVKTLFNNGGTLTSALTKAFNAAGNSKNLYLTILELESDKTLTNLTNGILIKRF